MNLGVTMPQAAEVVRVRGPELRKEFMELPFAIYRDDPLWIPPSRKREEELLAGSHPCSSFLESRSFLARAGDRPLGRITAFINHAASGARGPAAALGHFECVPDQAISSALFDAALDWLAARGARRVHGPLDGSIWISYRLVTAGFGPPPFPGEPYNRPYYPEFFQAAGFRPLQRWFSFVPRGRDLEKFDARGRDALERTTGHGYRFRRIDFGNLERELRIVHGLLMDSFSDFVGFHRLDFPVFFRMFGEMKSLSHPDLIRIAHDPEGRPVACFVCLFDHARAVRAMKGRDGLAARIRFHLHRRPASVLALYLGKAPGQGRAAAGVGLALTNLVLAEARRRGLEMTHALVAESSPMLKFAPRGREPLREYTLYERSLPE